jgi:hypothetical protein
MLRVVELSACSKALNRRDSVSGANADAGVLDLEAQQQALVVVVARRPCEGVTVPCSVNLMALAA